MKHIVHILKSACLIVLACLLFGQSIVAAEPLTGERLDSLNRDSVWYDNSVVTLQCFGLSSSIPNGTPTENGRAVFAFFTGKGLKPFQAAGIIGNMQVESGLQPQRLQGTASGVVTKAENVDQNRRRGWGIVQFDPPSKFISSQNPISKANELGSQLDFIWAQLNGQTKFSEKQAGDDIKASVDLRDAVLAWQGTRQVGGKYFGYERPANERASVGLRVSYATDALVKYGSDAATNPGANQGDSTCGEGGNSSNAVSGDFSLPVDQKWYDQHPDWFTKPHHDYPSADIPVPMGTKVYSMTSGRIIKAPIKDIHCSGCQSGSYGRGVEISYGNGIVIIYAHGSDGGSVPQAAQGATVKPGQLIMHSASTGNSGGPHLHFEIIVNGTSVCPQSLLKAIGDHKTTLPDIKSLPRSGCTY